MREIIIALLLLMLPNIAETVGRDTIYRTIVAEVTYYTASVEECGKSDGITASGTVARHGTIASDTLSFGTIVSIDGEEFTVEDTFGGQSGEERIDVFIPNQDRELAFKKGRVLKFVKIMEEK